MSEQSTYFDILKSLCAKTEGIYGSPPPKQYTYSEQIIDRDFIICIKYDNEVIYTEPFVSNSDINDNLKEDMRQRVVFDLLHKTLDMLAFKTRPARRSGLGDREVLS